MTTSKKEREKKKKAQRDFMIEQIASRVRIQQYQNYIKDKNKSPSFLGDQNVIPLWEQSDLASFSPSLPSLLLQQQQQQQQQTIDSDLPAFNPSLPSSISMQQQTVDDKKGNLTLPFKSCCLSSTLNQPPAPRYLTTLNQPLLDIPVPRYIKKEDFKIVSPFKMSVRPTADCRIISPSKKQLNCMFMNMMKTQRLMTMFNSPLPSARLNNSWTALETSYNLVEFFILVFQHFTSNIYFIL
jgi:hypothetical protein